MIHISEDEEYCSCGCNAHEHCHKKGCPHCDLKENTHIRIEVTNE